MATLSGARLRVVDSLVVGSLCIAAFCTEKRRRRVVALALGTWIESSDSSTSSVALATSRAEPAPPSCGTNA
jgi:hypothetical protein